MTMKTTDKSRTKPKNRTVNTTPSRRIERKHERLLKKLTRQIIKRLERAATPEAAERIYNKIINKTFNKWAKETSIDFVLSTNRYNKRKWDTAVKTQQKKIAAKLKQRMEEGVDEQVQDAIDENYKLIKSIPKKLKDRTKEMLSKRLPRTITAGERSTAIRKDLEEMGIKRAETIARTESSKLTTEFTKKRSVNLGVTAYVWSTSLDQRVRPGHQAMNNVICFWDDPPIPGRYEDKYKNTRQVHPGEDFNCRCVPLPIIDWDEITGRRQYWRNGQIKVANANEIKKYAGAVVPVTPVERFGAEAVEAMRVFSPF